MMKIYFSCLLAPQKLFFSMKKKKHYKGADKKLVLLVDIVDLMITQIISTKELYRIIEAAIESTMNKCVLYADINRQSIKAGIFGVQKRGSLLRIIVCSIPTLTKW